jgi:hypothetical protein
MKLGRFFLLTIVAATITALAFSCGGDNKETGDNETAGGPVSAEEIANAALLGLDDIPPDPVDTHPL